MSTTRDLIQRLTERLDHLHSNYDLPCQSALIAEALDYLDQPEPEGLTDEELLAILSQAIASFPPIHPEAEAMSAVEYDWELEIRKARAVIAAVRARWPLAAIEPVPVSKRLPGEGDCDPSFQCWWFTPSEEKWILWPIKWAGPECSHWLPHHALPLPTTTTETP